MSLSRQYIWLSFLFLLSGCVTTDPSALIFNTSPFSQAAQDQGNAHCASLYGNSSFNQLKGKMPVLPGALPSRAMLRINTAPDTQEMAAIKSLESAMRTCRQLRAAAGVPTSATEDILASRISKLRFGLANGSIPYAVYNYGVVQAMRENNAFMLGGAQAAQKGREIGRQKGQQFWQSTQQAIQMDTLQMNLNTYENQALQKVWTCTGGTYVTCY